MGRARAVVEDPGSEEQAMWESERLISDGVGRLMEFWGFKRNMGRIWSVLYLADEPVSASALRERLHMSAGAVSMSLNELLRWGVVKKVWIQGERRDFFVAEGQLWKMVSRVLREREFLEVVEAIATMEKARDALTDKVRDPDPVVRERARTQKARIEQLLELAQLGRTLLDALLNTARVDAGPLRRFLLGR